MCTGMTELTLSNVTTPAPACTAISCTAVYPARLILGSTCESVSTVVQHECGPGWAILASLLVRAHTHARSTGPHIVPEERVGRDRWLLAAHTHVRLVDAQAGGAGGPRVVPARARAR